MQVYRLRLATVLAAAVAVAGGWYWVVLRVDRADPPAPPLDPALVAEATRIDPTPADFSRWAAPRWVLTEYRGQACASGETAVGRTPAGGAVWAGRYETAVRVRGKTVTGTVAVRYEFAPDPPHRLAEFTHDATEGPSRRLAPGPDGAWVLTTSRAGFTHARRTDPVDYHLADHAAPELWPLDPGRRAGDRLVYRDLAAATGRVRPAECRVTRVDPGIPPRVAYETVLADGFRVAGECGGADPAWDRDGPFHTRDVSDRPNPGGWSPPTLVGHVPAPAPALDPFRVTGLRLRLTGTAAADVRDGPGQRVRTDARGITLATDRSRFPVRASPAELADGLSDTFEFPHRLPEARRLAREAVPDAAAPAREKADRLVRFVHDYVRYDGDADPPTVPALIAGRRGVCRHIADLFVTLARAVGLPARGANGLAWGDGTFAAHRWAEVVLDDGCWHPVDPTAGEPHAAVHIRLAGDDDADRVTDRLGDLSVSVVGWDDEPSPVARVAPYLAAAAALLVGLRLCVRFPAPSAAPPPPGCPTCDGAGFRWLALADGAGRVCLDCPDCLGRGRPG